MTETADYWDPQFRLFLAAPFPPVPMTRFVPGHSQPMPGRALFHLGRPGDFPVRWESNVSAYGEVANSLGLRVPLSSLGANAFQQIQPLPAKPRPRQKPNPLFDAPRSREHDIAEREGRCVAACDSYFKARPHLDTLANRRLFEAGFARGAE